MKNRDIPADAEATAVAVLAWLANEPDMLSRFLALSGVQPGQLRQAVNDPAFLAGMLEFLMQHEPTLMAFCAATETKPESVVEAYHRYAGPSIEPADC